MSTERGKGSAGVPPVPAEGDGGWHFRHYLPHYDRSGLVQMVTFGLADALPPEVVAKLSGEPTGRGGVRRRQDIQAALDAGHGACYLRDARIATLVEKGLLHFDGIRYHLCAWVIMPNHLHVLFETCQGWPMPGIIHSWKSLSSKLANELLGRAGQFWQRDYFDRAIRDEGHFSSAVEYIHNNPVKAGLGDMAGDWAFSSASRVADRAGTGGTPALPEGAKGGVARP